MGQVKRAPLLRYGVAVLSVALALVLTVPLGTVMTPTPFTLFLAAVMISAWYGGLGPGLLATALAAIADLYFLPLVFSPLVSLEEVVRLIVFSVVALLISSLNAARLRAERELSARVNQQAAVAQLGQQALADANTAKLMDEVATLVARTLEVEYCRVSELLPDRQTLFLKAGVGWRAGLVGRALVDSGVDSHAYYTLHSKAPVIIENLRTEKRFSSLMLQDHGVVSGVSIVIMGQEGPLGTLGAHTTKRRVFTQNDINFLQSVANVLAEAIERKQVEEALRVTNDELEGRVAARTTELSEANEELQNEIAERRRAEEEIKQRNWELGALNAVTAAVSSSLELSEVLATLEKLLAEQLGVAGGGIFLYGEAGEDTLYLHTAWGLPEAMLDRFKAFPVTAIHHGGAGEEKAALVSLDFSDVARLLDIDWGGAPVWRGCLSIPLLAEGQVQGFAVLFSRFPTVLGDTQLAFFKTLGQQVGVAIQNARLFEQVRTGRERLQTLSHRLVEVQETERRHIARELHDQIGQVLTGLKFVLEMSSRQPSDEVVESLKKAQGLVSELMARARNLSLDLRPAMLDDLGLLPALDWLFERYTAQTGVQVTFKHNGIEEQRFVSEIETAAYRIVQEALTNIARHARVREAMVHVWADEDSLCVQVEDQGAGFDPKTALAAQSSSGLPGMQERALLLGGNLAVESQPGAGARLTAELPLGYDGAEGEKGEYEHYLNSAGR